ncbi:Eukaryotic translation initiation factor 4 gamma 3 [Trichinella zimbabwensis]|uniref:Eukaryotic translation initiation factor 4 gamma 3 n=1 Tax=Trichinella zimbabwensis TaxID=268475 RepID=A0A0V1H5R7_9BILA|nr:Eukaryotic translation initiation factor 4 gamma 3 [Trichinella zimbabwensis]
MQCILINVHLVSCSSLQQPLNSSVDEVHVFYFKAGQHLYNWLLAHVANSQSYLTLYCAYRNQAGCHISQTHMQSLSNAVICCPGQTVVPPTHHPAQQIAVPNYPTHHAPPFIPNLGQRWSLEIPGASVQTPFYATQTTAGCMENAAVYPAFHGMYTPQSFVMSQVSGPYSGQAAPTAVSPFGIPTQDMPPPTVIRERKMLVVTNPETGEVVSLKDEGGGRKETAPKVIHVTAPPELSKASVPVSSGKEVPSPEVAIEKPVVVEISPTSSDEITITIGCDDTVESALPEETFVSKIKTTSRGETIFYNTAKAAEVRECVEFSSFTRLEFENSSVPVDRSTTTTASAAAAAAVAAAAAAAATNQEEQVINLEVKSRDAAVEENMQNSQAKSGTTTDSNANTTAASQVVVDRVETKFTDFNLVTNLAPEVKQAESTTKMPTGLSNSEAVDEELKKPTAMDVEEEKKPGGSSKVAADNAVESGGTPQKIIRRYTKEFMLEARKLPSSRRSPMHLACGDGRLLLELKEQPDSHSRPNMSYSYGGGGFGRSGRSGRSGGGGGGGGQPNRYIGRTSLPTNVQLQRDENPWKPSYLTTEDDSTEEARTERLLKNGRVVLNKLTPKNFDSMHAEFKKLAEDMNTEDRMEKLIELVFEKAISESNFCEIYSRLFHALRCESRSSTKTESPFIKHLLKRCQLEFYQKNNKALVAQRKELEERMKTAASYLERSEMASELEELEAQNKRRRLGVIRLIGELYKVTLLKVSILQNDVVKGLTSEINEENLECLCSLLTTVGAKLESEVQSDPNARQWLNGIFKNLKSYVENTGRPARIRFMIMDLLDLRESKYVPRHQVQKPKNLSEIEREMEEQRRQESARADELRMSTGNSLYGDGMVKERGRRTRQVQNRYGSSYQGRSPGTGKTQIRRSINVISNTGLRDTQSQYISSNTLPTAGSLKLRPGGNAHDRTGVGSAFSFRKVQPSVVTATQNRFDALRLSEKSAAASAANGAAAASGAAGTGVGAGGGGDGSSSSSSIISQSGGELRTPVEMSKGDNWPDNGNEYKNQGPSQVEVKKLNDEEAERIACQILDDFINGKEDTTVADVSALTSNEEMILAKWLFHAFDGDRVRRYKLGHLLVFIVKCKVWTLDSIVNGLVTFIQESFAELETDYPKITLYFGEIFAGIYYYGKDVVVAGSFFRFLEAFEMKALNVLIQALASLKDYSSANADLLFDLWEANGQKLIGESNSFSKTDAELLRENVKVLFVCLLVLFMCLIVLLLQKLEYLLSTEESEKRQLSRQRKKMLDYLMMMRPVDSRRLRIFIEREFQTTDKRSESFVGAFVDCMCSRCVEVTGNSMELKDVFSFEEMSNVLSIYVTGKSHLECFVLEKLKDYYIECQCPKDLLTDMFTAVAKSTVSAESFFKFRTSCESENSLNGFVVTNASLREFYKNLEKLRLLQLSPSSRY